MTAEERNRRLKYGHQVPPGWIADFHQPPESTAAQEGPGAAESSAAAAQEIHELQVFRQRRHQLLRREQSRRRQRNLRRLQQGIALLMVIVGFLAAALPGLAVGACIGLALISWRFKL